MGKDRVSGRRPAIFFADVELSSAGIVEHVEAKTSTNSGDTLSSYGVSVITAAATAGDNTFILPAAKTGVRKMIAVDVNTTDAVDIVGATTLQTFFGTTSNAIRFSTGAVAPKRAELIGRSTAAAGGWIVLHLSTGVTLIGTTVSTG
jgi:hypothetical protein